MKTKYRYSQNRFIYSSYCKENGGKLVGPNNCEICSTKLLDYFGYFIYLYDKLYCRECIAKLENTEADWAMGIVSQDSYKLI